MRQLLPLFAAIALLAAPGCVIVQTGVTNPIPAMRTIAVAPFLNLSAERSVDGRRFAFAYQAELQKIPGYQVIPVGIVEQAMVQLELNLDRPADAVKLAEAVGADAIVIGGITDYNPYYPPRIGLQVQWYSPYGWRFVPGVPTEAVTVLRGQSPDANALPMLNGGPMLPPQSVSFCPPHAAGLSGNCPPPWLEPGQPLPHDVTQPVMSYTRLFDGSDAELTATLRDYVALSGDRRSGGWEAYLHRSEDFIRFTAHRMIMEMLLLHGGEAKRRYVWLLPDKHS